MLYDNCNEKACLLNSESNLIFQNSLPRYNSLNIICIIKNKIWLTSHFFCRYETLHLPRNKGYSYQNIFICHMNCIFFLSSRFEFDILFSLCILFGQCTFHHMLGYNHFKFPVFFKL